MKGNNSNICNKDNFSFAPEICLLVYTTDYEILLL